MEALSEIYDALILFLTTPKVRALATVMSFASLCVSIWALRKTVQAIRTQSNDVKAEHARYLEDRWQELHALTLTSPEFAAQSARLFGTDEETAKREAALLMYLNLASVNFSQWRNKVIGDAVYDAHMKSIFQLYKGDSGELLRLLDLVGSDPAFRASCRTYMRCP